MAISTLNLKSLGLTDPGADKTIMWDDSASALTIAGQLGTTAVSQWRVTTSFTGAASPISSNLEEVDTDGYGRIGDAMSVSSGVWTFPSTGYWLIHCHLEFSLSGDTRYCNVKLDTTTDNSTYNEAAKSSTFIQQTESSSTHTSCDTFFVFDVTNTTNCKCKISTDQSSGSTTVYCDSSSSFTHFTFLRLGDT